MYATICAGTQIYIQLLVSSNQRKKFIFSVIGPTQACYTEIMLAFTCEEIILALLIRAKWFWSTFKAKKSKVLDISYLQSPNSDTSMLYDRHWHEHYNDGIMGAITSQITSLTIVYSIFYSDADQRKHQSSASLAFVRGIHRGPVNSPHKWPVTRKMFPFDDVIMKVEQVCGSQTNNDMVCPHLGSYLFFILLA